MDNLIHERLDIPRLPADGPNLGWDEKGWRLAHFVHGRL